ncbi:MAG: DGC domain protein [Methanoregulaceae archaeon PtaU1.Bin222]|nr:MAG: DGC domain protein [Methanoregulaceae archaeon PtaU1.Bin222]
MSISGRDISVTDDERPILLLTCSGISHAGQLTTLTGHWLYCLHPAMVSRHLKLTNLKRALESELADDEYMIVVDGCEKCCAKERIDLIGKVPDVHLVATREGITKRGMEEPRYDEIEGLSQGIMRTVRNGRRTNEESD